MLTPEPRDNKERPAFIPPTLKKKNTNGDGQGEKEEPADDNKMESDEDKDIEEKKDLVDDFPWPEEPDEDWDPTKFSIDWRKDYLLADESWKYHTIPEIMDGKNIADYVDEDILEKLDLLEKEESERLTLEENLLDMSDDNLELNQEEKAILHEIHTRKIKRRKAHSQEKGKNTPIVPQKFSTTKETNAMEKHLSDIGLDPTAAVSRARKRSRSESRGRSQSQERGRALSVDRSRSKSRAPTRSKTPHEEGFKNKKQKVQAEQKKRRGEKLRNRQARQGEADRHIPTKMPKHLFAGKRGSGKTDRR